MTSFFRFPHTPHLAWLGDGEPRDDKVLSTAEAKALLASDVVVEEKLDGANLGFTLSAEGDLLAAVRAVVGPAVPILAELDLHCHLTRLKVDSADALVIFKEYPHIDVRERAAEVFTLLERMFDSGLKPVMALHDCRMLGFYPTTREPMLGIVREMQRLERERQIVAELRRHAERARPLRDVGGPHAVDRPHGTVRLRDAGGPGDAVVIGEGEVGERRQHGQRGLGPLGHELRRRRARPGEEQPRGRHGDEHRSGDARESGNRAHPKRRARRRAVVEYRPHPERRRTARVHRAPAAHRA